jgi:phenylalanyl-tRNA synthetase alpha chain
VSGTTELLAILDPDWSVADPRPLAPEHDQRVAELEGLDPELAELYRRGAEALAGSSDPATLHERHVALLGRERGVVTRALSELPQLPVEARKVRGRALNLIKRWLGELEEARRKALEREAEERTAATMDVSLPGRRPWIGHPHVLARIQADLLDLFHGLGYSVYTSPEVELDAYNFGKLNFPPDHPARDAHDTYWIQPGSVLLRTHTSPGWVRAMEERKPPLRLVFPGRVFRAEQVDASHMDQFHQIDGLVVDRNVSMAHLKGTLAIFARAIYGPRVRTRLVPIFFPFVEPGCQLDIACAICDGSGETAGGRCAVCKGSGWSELLGAGMVHPNVFRAVGYDPEEVTGFAFGMGLERIAMARYGVPEIRLFLENDLRFLSQF